MTPAPWAGFGGWRDGVVCRPAMLVEETGPAASLTGAGETEAPRDSRWGSPGRTARSAHGFARPGVEAPGLGQPHGPLPLGTRHAPHGLLVPPPVKISPRRARRESAGSVALAQGRRLHLGGRSHEPPSVTRRALPRATALSQVPAIKNRKLALPSVLSIAASQANGPLVWAQAIRLAPILVDVNTTPNARKVIESLRFDQAEMVRDAVSEVMEKLK
ncbi:MAG: repeat protein [Gemmataceae bacterium]|nr:repeat protein [Gemmataceae bacterium]